MALAARAGRADALELFERRGFASGLEGRRRVLRGAGALAQAVWCERTDTVRLLLARGAAVSPDVVELAERALTETSEWTPHRSREILDLLRP